MQGRQAHQPELFSMFHLESVIPKHHLLRKIDEKLDLSFVREATAELYCRDNGRPSIDPELFIRICLLTYLYDIPSDRQVCEEIGYNLSYRWFLKLSMQDPVPDHSSLTRIRDRLGERVFKEIFEHVVRLCVESGIVKGDKVMMDSSLIKADAALSSLSPKEENLNLHDNAPRKNIKGRKFSNETHISRTDPDSRLAGKAKDQKKLYYKVHETIDRESRIIVDTHITGGSETDGTMMFERLDHIEETFNFRVEEFTGDRGYGYGVNLDRLEKRGIKSFVPNFHRDVGVKSYDPELFKYDEEKDHFTCLKGHALTPMNIPSNLEQYQQTYTLLGGHCKNCVLKPKCFPTELKAPRGKRIARNIFWKLQEQTSQREKTVEFRKLRKERQWKIEGIFAEAKEYHGLSRARYRGRFKMQIQAYMTAVVQNLKRLTLERPVIEVALSYPAQAITTMAQTLRNFFVLARRTRFLALPY
jgi:transposase